MVVFFPIGTFISENQRRKKYFNIKNLNIFLQWEDKLFKNKLQEDITLKFQTTYQYYDKTFILEK